MTAGEPAPSARAAPPPWWRRTLCLVLVVTLAGGGAAACTARGGGTSPPGADRATTSTRPGAGPGSSTTTTTAAEADPGPQGPDDVPDEVFAGLGDPRIDVHHYDVRVEADPRKAAITGTATLTLAATTPKPLGSFTLDLRGPDVTSVEVDGRDAEVDATDTELTVTPAEPLRPDREVEVAIAYAGEPDAGDFPGLGVPVGWQPDDEGGWFAMSEPDGTATWVPVSDHLSDKATWTITLSTPKAVTGVANGRLTSSEVVGDRREWVWTTDQQMAPYLALAAVGNYDLVQRKGPAGTQVVFAFPRSVPAANRRGFDELDPILTFYAETFGAYPDDDAGAIVAPTSLGLALETQTRPLFGLDAVSSGRTWALAHELAHQWFGDAVTPESWEDLWLNEGFATYADWLYRDHTGDGDIATIARQAGVPTRGDLAVLDTEAAATFDGAVYEGGARALHALRLTIGDADFFEILRTWVADNDGANVTTDDFIALASKVSGQDLTAFFDAWLRSADQPDFPR